MKNFELSPPPEKSVRGRAGTMGCMYLPWVFRLHKGQLRNETRHVKILSPGNTVFEIGENRPNKKFVITSKKKGKINFSEVFEKFSTENNFIQNNSKYHRLCCLKVTL